MILYGEHATKYKRNIIAGPYAGHFTVISFTITYLYPQQMIIKASKV
jgi:hypothetical protein